jgi:hypothetical protein
MQKWSLPGLTGQSRRCAEPWILRTSRSMTVFFRKFCYLLYFYSGLLVLGALCSPLRAQSGIDITGRASLNVKNVTYDEQSRILPDSVNQDTYSKTTLIPGLQQGLNLALFGRTRHLDMTLLADLKSNPWNTFDIKNPSSVSRLTFDMRMQEFELNLGDFFESGSDLFIQSREIRGGRFKGRFVDIFGKESFLELRALGGFAQRAINVGEHSEELYKIHETTGQYSRILTAGTMQGGQSGFFDLALNYLTGKDDMHSVDESVNEPMANNVAGSVGNIYLWDKRLKIFGECNLSMTDTLSGSDTSDFAYRTGVDVRSDNFKLLLFYQRLGYNYLSFGFPFLENDKQGTLGQLAYSFPDLITLLSDFEVYHDNLNNQAYRPNTDTYTGTIGFTTKIKDIPEITFKYGQRVDKSKVVLDIEGNPIKTDKETQKVEGRIGYRFNQTRLSISAIHLDMDDRSLVSAGSPLGTKQFVGNLNFYSRVQTYLFFSGGALYSRLAMTDNKKNENIYLYETTRWDILPLRLRFENTFTLITNKASGSAYEAEDMLGNFVHFLGEISIEYFFTNTLSFKLIAGTDSRRFDYTDAAALRIIADPDYGPTYFNSQESYQGLIYGGELNWIF